MADRGGDLGAPSQVEEAASARRGRRFDGEVTGEGITELAGGVEVEDCAGGRRGGPGSLRGNVPEETGDGGAKGGVAAELEALVRVSISVSVSVSAVRRAAVWPDG